ncbi:MAG TPA: histidine phosphatase family protein [Cyclobacteriaceae bacterium]
MSIKKIYLVRHGETEQNRQGIVQGSGIDSSLNETGYNQARLFFEKYKDFSFDKVYTSALQRSVQSMELFIDSGVPHEKLAGLNEIHWGESEGKKFGGKNDKYYRELVGKWKSGMLDYPLPGGESPSDLKFRLSKALLYIMSKNDERQVLICMHGRAIRALLCIMLNYPLSRMEIFEHTNFSLYQLLFSGSMFRIETYNETLKSNKRI